MMNRADFKMIPGYDDLYMVDTSGNVLTIGRHRVREKILRRRNLKTGYQCYTLQKNRVIKVWLIHRLVATVFLPNPTRKKFVNHKDGDKKNNAALNLEWVTQSENEIHAHKNGLKNFRKDRNPNSKLSEPVVNEIRRRYDCGTVTQSALAKEYGVDQSTISCVINKKLW